MFLRSYFNTVGSKEGWTPSTFVSSRANRKKDEKHASRQRPEDFMDDEDLADAADAQRVQTADSFAGLGSTEGDVSRRGAILDLFKTEGETMGTKLLKKMGWREGQGIGPKVRRKAQLGDSGQPGGGGDDATHLFAPANTRMIGFVRKNDHKGLGYEGQAALSSEKVTETSTKSDDDSQDFGTAVSVRSKKKKKPVRGGIGIGILNDTGSDDEDPYEIGPRISYNRVIEGDKKKKKPLLNGSVRPVFISKKDAAARVSRNFRKCHDGRLPLDGFVLSTTSGSSSSIITSDGKYLPPEIPEGWKSSKQPTSNSNTSYLSTAEVARASTLDPKSRATLLGEAQLPGKSVFDYLSSAARDRLASASGKTNLPPALGEVPKGYSLTEEERRKELFNQVPKLDRDTAIAALGKGASGWMPYADDESKRARYREYLENQAGLRENLPQRVPGITTDHWIKELQEFAHCAQIFKPMTGMMATRFTSSSAPKPVSEAPTIIGSESLLSKPVPKEEDSAEAAAKVGMFGPMTRSTQDFYPSRLLCKRFNVKPPAHVQLDPNRTADDAGDDIPGGGFQSSDGQPAKNLDLVSKSAIDDMLRESGGRNQNWISTNTGTDMSNAFVPPAEIIIDSERNEALEGERAGEAVFKAIFGDDDDDDDD